MPLGWRGEPNKQETGTTSDALPRTSVLPGLPFSDVLSVSPCGTVIVGRSGIADRMRRHSDVWNDPRSNSLWHACPLTGQKHMLLSDYPHELHAGCKPVWLPSGHGKLLYAIALGSGIIRVVDAASHSLLRSWDLARMLQVAWNCAYSLENFQQLHLCWLDDQQQLALGYQNARRLQDWHKVEAFVTSFA